MKKRILLLAIAATAAFQFVSAQPRLIVEIVVGSMRAGDLDRYGEHFGDGGLRLITERGTVYTASRYDFQQTLTPVTLSTLATGAMPSNHGVTGNQWIDYTSNKTVQLIDGKKGAGGYNLIAPTLSETLIRQSAGSQAVSIAVEPTSAIMMAGKVGQAFWIEPEHCDWTTSLYYAQEMPAWIGRSNKEHYNLSYIAPEWRTLFAKDKYLNSRHWGDVIFADKEEQKGIISKLFKGKPTPPTNSLKLATDYERLLYTPAGNSAVLGMAKQAIANYKLGDDAKCDLLTICLDSPRYISEAYGPESVEVEDMYYRLDRDLKDFLTFVFAQVKENNALIVLTSDHGTSESYDMGLNPADRFNPRQFEVIVNSFLGVRYGVGNWVTKYADHAIWLNHNFIYERGLNLADVQNEVAIFAMQFSGVSHALSASAMRNSYFGSGYAQRIQNSFYPRRSGDVVLNLVPGCIDERERCRSMSGSLYGYDTDVPLVFYGKRAGILHVKRRVDMTSVAPTLAHLIGIPEPAASEGEVLEEFTY